jgi:3-deoxy-D-manno-octulosonic-acid transferase
MIRIVYSFILLLITPLVVLRLYWRSLRAPDYRRRILERFAFFANPKLTQGVWVHAVSVGEVIVATPLIKRLRQTYPQLPIVVTTMTPTGSQQVQRNFADDKNIFHVYAPYDLPSVVRRFLRKLQPRMLIIMETELWPNMIHCCHQQHIPVVLANARLSRRSARGYTRILKLVKPMLNNIDQIVAQSRVDAKRFACLGMPSQKISVSGSIKFDLQLSENIFTQAVALRQQWGKQRPVWVAGSTHEGEDEIILRAFEKVKKCFKQVLLVLVPRHPERFAKVTQLAKKHGYRVVQRSQASEDTSQAEVFIGDSMGELNLFYAAADITFVGGSLVPHGGHNLLEPAVLAKPIIIGPHMFNFAQITQLLRRAHALYQVDSEQTLAKTVLQLLADANLRAELGDAAQAVVLKNRGAIDKHLELIRQYIDSQ